MDSFTLIFEQDNVKTTIVVRSKNGKGPISGNYNFPSPIPINSTLDVLGLERVPFSELVPSYRQIKADDQLIGQPCTICQIDYSVKEYKRELGCGHAFHKKCIDKWLKTHLTCPYCRRGINESSSKTSQA